MLTYIGTVNIITVEDHNYNEEIYRDINSLRREFIHPHKVLTDISKQKQEEYVTAGYHIQSIIITPAEIIW